MVSSLMLIDRCGFEPCELLCDAMAMLCIVHNDACKHSQLLHTCISSLFGSRLKPGATLTCHAALVLPQDAVR
jgi:hypothetical protein